MNPANWTFKTYLWVASGLLLINLLGPRGLVHFIVIHQEAERLSAEAEKLKQEQSVVKSSISDFKNSSNYRDAMIRERLGYLKKDELLLKFVSIKDEDGTP